MSSPIGRCTRAISSGGHPERGQRRDVRSLVPRVAHHADPAGGPGQRVAQQLPQLLAVVVGDDDVRGAGGEVRIELGEAPGRRLAGRHPRGVRLHQGGSEAEVGAVAEQEGRHRRGEDRDQQAVGRCERIRAHPHALTGLSP